MRRLEEKNRHAEVKAMLDHLNTRVPADSLTWIMPDVPCLFQEVLGIIRSYSDALNFNDALIALSCCERGAQRLPVSMGFSIRWTGCVAFLYLKISKSNKSILFHYELCLPPCQIVSSDCSMWRKDCSSSKRTRVFCLRTEVVW